MGKVIEKGSLSKRNHKKTLFFKNEKQSIVLSTWNKIFKKGEYLSDDNYFINRNSLAKSFMVSEIPV